MLKIFDNLFESAGRKQEPLIQLGRYSDLYKKREKYLDWDKALFHYKKGEYFLAFQYFLNYLADDDLKNVFLIEKSSQKINFKLIQGSKVISGLMNADGIFAEAKLATGNIGVEAMRSLLSDNYGLKYTRYALDGDDMLTMVFQSELIDASPYKLYNGLKELSIRADQQDDLLVNNFDELEPLKNLKIHDIAPSIKKVKYEYLKTELHQILSGLSEPTLSFNEYPGSLSYFILDFIYRIDYFLKPEGRLLELIETTDSIYFNSGLLTPQQKNEEMIKTLRLMDDLSFEEISEELYETIHTFGIPEVGGRNQLNDFLTAEMKQFQWYVSSGHTEIAQSICNFIAGHILYKYAMPQPLQLLLQLYMRIVEDNLFTNMGFESLLDKNNLPDGKKIVRRTDAIRQEISDRFQMEKISFKSFRTESLIAFSESWLNLLHEIQYEKINFS